MNYGELKQAILDDTHRPNLAPHVARFVRQCEAKVRRELKGFFMSGTLTESDRINAGSYQLPTGVVVLRYVRLTGRQGDGLKQIHPTNIQRLDSAADPWFYSLLGDNTILFRGVPGENTQFGIGYFGLPDAFVDDTDQHNLLTAHEDLYMAGSKFYLYLHTQDRELAADELNLFNGIIEDLNEFFASKIGGASIAPAYNFAGGSSY